MESFVAVARVIFCVTASATCRLITWRVSILREWFGSSGQGIRNEPSLGRNTNYLVKMHKLSEKASKYEARTGLVVLI